MSDQSFGKASREAWDDRERAWEAVRRADLLASITVRTDHVFPPIPDRNSDWSAVDDDTYDGPGSPIGWGRTEQAAIDDLIEQLLDRQS